MLPHPTFPRSASLALDQEGRFAVPLPPEGEALIGPRGRGAKFRVKRQAPWTARAAPGAGSKFWGEQTAQLHQKLGFLAAGITLQPVLDPTPGAEHHHLRKASYPRKFCLTPLFSRTFGMPPPAVS
jgi:hypothetical protein